MDLFRVHVESAFYLLAENEIDAQELAKKMTAAAMAEMPGSVIFNITVWMSLNQSEALKSLALNSYS